MKIIHFNKELPSDRPNGVSVQVHRLAQKQVEKGHDVTVVSFSDCVKGCKYKTIKLSYQTHNKLLKKFLPAYKFAGFDVSGYDIVHYHGDDYLCKGRKNRVRTFYGTAFFEAKYAKSIKRKLYQGLFWIFELISSIKKGVKCSISESSKKVIPNIEYIVPCGVDISKYTFTKQEDKYEKPTIFFIGDFNSRKEGFFLLEVFDNLKRKIDNLKLVIVGPEKIKYPGVICMGQIEEENLIELYKKSWVYALSSSYEGFGVPAIEAMACGCVVVSVENMGIKEIIENGKNGIITNKRNFEKELYNILVNRDLREKISYNALQLIKNSYDIEIIAKKYEDIYESILND